MEYKDELTAFNALKKATMAGKGKLNNLISSKIFEHLSALGFPTHFIRRLDELNQLVKRVTIVPLEVVVRNLTTGSICKRLGVQEGCGCHGLLLSSTSKTMPWAIRWCSKITHSSSDGPRKRSSSK